MIATVLSIVLDPDSLPFSRLRYQLKVADTNEQTLTDARLSGDNIEMGLFS